MGTEGVFVCLERLERCAIDFSPPCVHSNSASTSKSLTFARFFFRKSSASFEISVVLSSEINSCFLERFLFSSRYLAYHPLQYMHSFLVYLLPM